MNLNIILIVVLLFSSAVNIGATVKLFYAEQKIANIFCIEAKNP